MENTLTALNESADLFTGLSADADQMLINVRLNADAFPTNDVRSLIARNLVENSSNRRIEIERNGLLVHWATLRPNWNEDILINDRSKVAAAESKLVNAILSDLQSNADETLAVPNWGNLYWSDLLDPLPLYDHDHDPLKLLKFMLLPRHDLHAWTTEFNGSSVISLDASVEPVFTLLNCIFAHYQNEVRQLSISRCQHYCRWIHLLLGSVFGDADLDQAPFFPCMPTSGFFQMQSWTKLQVQFLMSHELGHFLLGHNSSSSTIRSTLKEHYGFELQGLSRSFEHEFAADSFAMSFLKDKKTNLLHEQTLGYMTKEAAKRVNSEKVLEELRSIGSAVHLAFCHIGLFESFLGQSKIAQGKQLESHPTAKERVSSLKRLYPATHRRANEFVTIADTLVEMFSDYLKAEPPLPQVSEVIDGMKPK